jgi:hypothetical protein
MAELDPHPSQSLTYAVDKPANCLSENARVAVIVTMLSSLTHFAKLQALPAVFDELAVDVALSHHLKAMMGIAMFASWAGGVLLVAGGIVTLASRGRRRGYFCIGCLLSAAGAVAWLVCAVSELRVSPSLRSFSAFQQDLIQHGGITPFISAVALPLLACYLVRRNSGQETA